MIMKMCYIPDGRYKIGATKHQGFLADKEGPAVEIEMKGFWIGQTPVTNAQFLDFIEATGYKTDAESLGWSYCFGYFLESRVKQSSKPLSNAGWWYQVAGASFRCPEGEGSDIQDRMNHPVVHISRNDAIAYCLWGGYRLPTEAEWEVAAKGGTQEEYYPWGEDLCLDGKHHCNIWQGKFPSENTIEDGYSSTAPVHTYEPNGYGCYQMIGNVWEWCSNPGRVDLSLFAYMDGEQIWNSYQTRDDREYGIKGGSFLCHASYCDRYRIAARSVSKGMESTNNLGFRVVKREI